MVDPTKSKIELCQTLAEIAEYRRQQFLTESNSGDDYTSILTEIYQKPLILFMSCYKTPMTLGRSMLGFAWKKTGCGFSMMVRGILT